MMDPAAGTAVMRGGTLKWYQSAEPGRPPFPHAGGAQTSCAALQMKGSSSGVMKLPQALRGTLLTIAPQHMEVQDQIFTLPEN